MNILYIANIRLPTEKAHGIQIIKMCEAFSNNGHNITLLVPRRLNNIKEDPFSYYKVKENFKIKALPTIDLVKFGKIGFLIQTISFSKFAALYVLFKKFDFIYSRDEIPLFFAGLFAKNIVYEAHTPRFNFIIKKLKKIVTISNGLKNFYISKGVSEDKILVAHDGVDLEDFDIKVNKNDVRQKLGLPVNNSIAMYIGRLDPWKGVETLLKASRLIPDITVVIAGEGSQFKKFKKEYTNVIFLGHTRYSDLPKNQRSADVLVIPNSTKSDVSRLYTSPLKVFAHMASGVPIIASDLPSIREILSEKNSTLVESDNPKALADGIKEALRKGGKKAMNDVRMYTWERRAKKIIQFINV